MDEKPSPPQAKIPESEDEQEKVIKLLEDRLEKHDDNRKAVQEKIKVLLNKLTEQIDGLEDGINRELCEKFTSEEDRLQRTLDELCGSSTISTLQKAKAELRATQSYEIFENKKPNNDFTTLYELKTEKHTVSEDGYIGLAISEMSRSTHCPPNATGKSEIPCGSAKFAKERERLIELLKECLKKHDNNRKAAQDKLHEICEKLRTQIVELEDRVNKELEKKFTPEDNRLQAALSEFRGNSTIGTLQKAKAELLVEQLYEIIENNFDSNFDLTTLYKLKAERRIIPELMEMRKPTNVRVAGVNSGVVSVKFTCLNPDEEIVLSDNTVVNPVKYKCLLFKKGNEQESKEYPFDKDENNSFIFTPDFLESETQYGTRVKMVVESRECEWSGEIAEFTTPAFKECCVWKKCPGYVDKKKYRVDEKNPRVATKINSNFCVIIGNTYIPLNKVTSWSIKILKSRRNDGEGIYIGIAPSNINQNDDDNYNKYGWYFDCFSSALRSRSPHNYNGKDYGPRKRDRQYVHTGDSVGVVMDTTKGNLSFALNGVNYGAAYCGIPLDKPLVPCVLLLCNGDSVELDPSEVKESVDSSIPVPSSIIAKSSTWDTIALTWDNVADASFYQVEVDENKHYYATTANSLTKRRLFPETEHNFRVRTVRGSSVCKWSGTVKGRTLKAPEFPECVWKKCPDDVGRRLKYSVDWKNPRVATKINGNGYYCTTIGNTLIPLNTVKSWSIEILKSRYNNGGNIYIGIAPSDINQNEDDNDDNCGWYFNCYISTLCSGPPHNYRDKEYGSRKEGGQYVHTGDSVGVVVDTTRGDLSFVLNGVNLGVAYEGIPLDKPLVPCVLLEWQGDSVELVI